MTTSVDQLFQAAMKLPDEEQLQLVTVLTAAVEERGLRPFDDWWVEKRVGDWLNATLDW